MGTALVTGANRGIGLELARQLRDKGETVVAAVRTSSPELDGLGVEIILGVDLARPETFKPVRARMGARKISLLLHNAGILERDGLLEVTRDALLRQFEVNALGPVLLTRALLDHLERGSKLAFVTSRMGSIGDNSSGGYYGYRMSKAALNMAATSMTLDLKERGIAVALLHPGYVRTAMTGNQGSTDAKESARDLLRRIDDLTLETSGGFGTPTANAYRGNGARPK